MSAKKSGVVRRIALERIVILYRLAEDTYKTDPDLSRRYLRLVKQISSHYKIKLAKEMKRHICRKCGSLLVPGDTLSVRLASSKRLVMYKCGNCGAEASFPY
jgi:ribonuclease P protein subunit RPR2